MTRQIWLTPDVVAEKTVNIVSYCIAFAVIEEYLIHAKHSYNEYLV